jgi:Ca2+-binding EF-hand superfamily protein
MSRLICVAHFKALLLRDKSGHISHHELKTLFAALEIDASDQEVMEVLKQMDTDGGMLYSSTLT